MGIHYVVEHRKTTSPFSIYGPENHLCTKPRGNNNITLCVLGENIFTVDTFTHNYKMYSFSRHYVSAISLYLIFFIIIFPSFVQHTCILQKTPKA